MHEPLLQQRIEKAQKRAQELLTGSEITEDGLIMQYRFALSQKLHIGIFSDYFDNLTLDQLALEYYLWIGLHEASNPELMMQKQTQQYTNTIKEQIEKGKDLFEEDWEEIVDTTLDDKFLEQAKKDFEERNKNG